MSDSLSDYFSQFGVNTNTGGYDTNLATLIQQAQQNVQAKAAGAAGSNPIAGWTLLSSPSYQTPYSVYRDASGAMKYLTPGALQEQGNAGSTDWVKSIGFQAENQFSPDRSTYALVNSNGNLVDLGGGKYGQVSDTAPQFSYQKVLYPDDSLGSFLGSSLGNFMSGPGAVIGAGMGISGLMGGGLPGLGNLFGGGSSGGGGMFDWLTNLFSSGGNGIPNMADPFGYNAFDYSGFNSGGSLLGNAADAYNFPVDPNLIPQGSGAGGNVYGPSGLTNTLNNLKTASSIFGNMGGGGALGGLLGALAGGIGANSKPAGTTTSIQDIPDYLKPYQSMNLTSGVNNFANASAGQALLPGAQNYLQKTINGDFLDPNQNPAFQPYVKDLMGQAGANYAGLYGKNPDNLNNSGFQEGYTRAITNAVLPLYNSAFQTAQGNQYNAASNAPAYANNVAGAALAPNLAFKNLYTGPTANTQPYFTNPMGGALSGGLAGYTFGNSIFGSKN